MKENIQLEISSLDKREKIINECINNWEQYIFQNLSNIEKLINVVPKNNITRNNHVGSFGYYYAWSEDKDITPKKKRRKKAKVILKDKEVKLNNFMAKDYLFLQELEDLLTNFNYEGISYNTEEIQIFKILQKSIEENKLENIFFMVQAEENILNKHTHNFQSFFEIKNDKHMSEEIKDELEKQKIQLQQVGVKKINLFINFFKARQTLWRKINKNNKINKLVCSILDDLINEKKWRQEEENIVKVIIHTFIHKYITSVHGVFPINVLKNEIIIKNYQKLPSIKGKEEIAKIFLQIINTEIIKYDVENSFFYKQVVSNYLYNLGWVFIKEQQHLGTVILMLKNKLQIKENPILYYNINYEEIKLEIIENIKLGILDKKHLKFLEKTTENHIYMLPITPNILLINAANWFCDILSSHYKYGNEKFIFDLYNELYNSELNNNNDLEIIKIK